MYIDDVHRTNLIDALVTAITFQKKQEIEKWHYPSPSGRVWAWMGILEEIDPKVDSEIQRLCQGIREDYHKANK